MGLTTDNLREGLPVSFHCLGRDIQEIHQFMYTDATRLFQSAVRRGGTHGFLLTIAPNPPPPSGTSLRCAIKKLLSHAAIGFSYRRYVAAYPPGRVHRAVPPKQNRQTALRQRLAARDQARWLSGHRPQECRTGKALQPSRQ